MLDLLPITVLDIIVDLLLDVVYTDQTTVYLAIDSLPGYFAGLPISSTLDVSNLTKCNKMLYAKVASRLLMYKRYMLAKTCSYIVRSTFYGTRRCDFYSRMNQLYIAFHSSGTSTIVANHFYIFDDSKTIRRGRSTLTADFAKPADCCKTTPHTCNLNIANIRPTNLNHSYADFFCSICHKYAFTRQYCNMIYFTVYRLIYQDRQNAATFADSTIKVYGGPTQISEVLTVVHI
jgi:hypothetical protein